MPESLENRDQNGKDEATQGSSSSVQEGSGEQKDKEEGQREAVKKDPSGGNTFDSIWIEKYRPETLDDVVGNEEVLRRLKIIAREGNMPHLMLAVGTAPPSTQKRHAT